MIQTSSIEVSQNDWTFLRVRSLKHEIMVCPEKDFMMIVVQVTHFDYLTAFVIAVQTIQLTEGPPLPRISSLGLYIVYLSQDPNVEERKTEGVEK